MTDVVERIASLFAEIVTFVVAGIIFEVLYFQVLPQFFAEQHFSLPYAILFWGLLVGLIISFFLRDIKYTLKEGVPFSVGVVWFAYQVHDWYSFIVAIIGIILGIAIKVYA